MIQADPEPISTTGRDEHQFITLRSGLLQPHKEVGSLLFAPASPLPALLHIHGGALTLQLGSLGPLCFQHAAMPSITLSVQTPALAKSSSSDTSEEACLVEGLREERDTS